MWGGDGGLPQETDPPRGGEGSRYPRSGLPQSGTSLSTGDPSVSPHKDDRSSPRLEGNRPNRLLSGYKRVKKSDGDSTLNPSSW